jgi:hypothetical protein
MIQVTVERLGFDQDLDQAVVILSDLSKTTLIPIWIRALEAAAIALPLQGTPPPRPVTADLLVSVLDRLDVTVTMVIIRELKDEVFYASLVLDSHGREFDFDCRPSDAIAIALRKGSPLFVAEKVMAEAGIPAGEASVQ